MSPFEGINSMLETGRSVGLPATASKRLSPIIAVAARRWPNKQLSRYGVITSPTGNA